MPEHAHFDDQALFNKETQHETSDVSVRALLIFMGICVVFALVTHLLLWLMFKVLVKIENSQQSAANTSMSRPAVSEVPPPRLQPFPTIDQRGREIAPYENTPVTDMIDMRSGQEAHLSGYGWVDQSKGTVYVPIEAAKKMLLLRGLPVASSSAAMPAPPAIAASNAGGGMQSGAVAQSGTTLAGGGAAVGGGSNQ